MYTTCDYCEIDFETKCKCNCNAELFLEEILVKLAVSKLIGEKYGDIFLHGVEVNFISPVNKIKPIEVCKSQLKEGHYGSESSFKVLKGDYDIYPTFYYEDYYSRQEWYMIIPKFLPFVYRVQQTGTITTDYVYITGDMWTELVNKVISDKHKIDEDVVNKTFDI